MEILKLKRASIKYRKVVDEDSLAPKIEIVDFTALSDYDIEKLPHYIECRYICKDAHFYMEDEELEIHDNECIVISKGDRMSPNEFDKIVTIMKKAGKRLAKIRDEYYKELRKKKEEWEDDEVKEIII
jgi:arsenate reductase-like glutaredoxin family protein